jgi:hypothetical protein
MIVVGGAAATAFGSARLTLDLDVVYPRTPQNLGRLVRAIAELEAIREERRKLGL